MQNEIVAYKIAFYFTDWHEWYSQIKIKLSSTKWPLTALCFIKTLLKNLIFKFHVYISIIFSE